MDPSEVVKQDKYNTEAWGALMAQAAAAPIEEARPTFMRFVKIFPTAARHWKIWIEKEMQGGNLDQVELLFQQCLFNNLDIDLWRTYLSYIRLIKKGEKDELSAMNQAFEFVLKRMGIDVSAVAVWSAHLSFLKHELRDIDSNDKRAAIRGVYHHAIMVPMSGVDQIWREYDSWEHSEDKNLAKNILQSFHSQHLTAKMCARHRRRLKRQISTTMLATPPRGTAQQRDKDYLQVVYWTRLLDYEKSNPQRLTPTQLEERVVFTYKQALQTLRHYPEVWDSYARYMNERHEVDNAVEIYEKAVEAIPDSMLMSFLFAEFLESQKRYTDARKVYQKLVSVNDSPLAHIQFYRFSRRAEGKKQAQKVFIRARKSKNATYHIYVYAALTEYFQNNDTKVAQKIFKLGFDTHAHEPEFVLQYLEFLRHRNDVNNLRAVFERVLKEMDPKKAVPIWEKYIEFESQHGDLKALKQAETRREKNLGFSEVQRRQGLYKRYGFLDLLPCSSAHYATLERIKAVRLPSLALETKGRTFEQNEALIDAIAKRYTSATELHIVKPDESQLVEYKPGNPFLLEGQPVMTRDGREWPVPELVAPLQRLLDALPPSQISQGIPITPDHLCSMISSAQLPSDPTSAPAYSIDDFTEMLTGEKRQTDEEDEHHHNGRRRYHNNSLLGGPHRAKRPRFN